MAGGLAGATPRLNEQQQACADYRGPALMVVACPGSGKTRVITEAIRQRVESGEVHASQVLAVTFTRMAAAEMRKRLKGLRVTVGTFHSICYDLICTHWRDLGFATPEIAILDRGEQRRLVTDVLQRSQRGRRVTQRAFIDALDARARNVKPEPEIERLMQRYERALREHNAVDYSTIPVYAMQVVDEWGAATGIWTDVFVDEAQDLDPLQWHFFESLEARTMFVGDPDQLIYGWRSASTGLMLHKMSEMDSRVLDINYRSGREIVEAADRLIVHNHDRLRDEPMTHLDRDCDLQVIPEDEFVEHCRACVVTDVHEGDVAEYGRTAVLARTNRILSLVSRELLHADVDHVLIGKRERVLEDDAVKDVVAYLVAPAMRYNAALAERVLAAEGYREITVAAMREEAATRGVGLIDQAMQQSDELRAFYEQIDGEGLPIQMGMAVARVARKHIEPTYARSLHQLVAQFCRWEPKHSQRTAARFCAWLNLRDGQDEIDLDVPLQLMTMHAAKGLEFSTVYVVGLRKGVIPDWRNEADGIEEERRVLYVAMTRAVDRLVLVVPDRDPSPFVQEITDGNAVRRPA